MTAISSTSLISYTDVPDCLPQATTRHETVGSDSSQLLPCHRVDGAPTAMSWRLVAAKTQFGQSPKFVAPSACHFRPMGHVGGPGWRSKIFHTPSSPAKFLLLTQKHLDTRWWSFGVSGGRSGRIVAVGARRRKSFRLGPAFPSPPSSWPKRPTCHAELSAVRSRRRSSHDVAQLDYGVKILVKQPWPLTSADALLQPLHHQEF